MKKNLIIFAAIVVIIAGGCGNKCKNPEIIEIGELTQKQLDLVPYTDGQTIRLKHSGGLIIDYAVSRSTRTETREYPGYCETLRFRVNTTTLTPSYPVFTISLYVANVDFNYTAFEGSVGKYYYMFPRDTVNFQSYGDMRDIEINDTVYTKVFRMKTPSYSINPNEIIYADSLYYNFTSGVIRIIMSNGENYTIYE